MTIVAHRKICNAKLGVRIDEASKLSLIFNSVDIKADDLWANQSRMEG